MKCNALYILLLLNLAENAFQKNDVTQQVFKYNKQRGWQKRELLKSSPASLWLSAADHDNWTWHSTASSDQTVGQVFELPAIFELVDDSAT